MFFNQVNSIKNTEGAHQQLQVSVSTPGRAHVSPSHQHWYCSRCEELQKTQRQLQDQLLLPVHQSIWRGGEADLCQETFQCTFHRIRSLWSQTLQKLQCKLGSFIWQIIRANACIWYQVKGAILEADDQCSAIVLNRFTKRNNNYFWYFRKLI